MFLGLLTILRLFLLVSIFLFRFVFVVPFYILFVHPVRCNCRLTHLVHMEVNKRVYVLVQFSKGSIISSHSLETKEKQSQHMIAGPL